MKKLFVIHTINKKNKKENKELLCCKDKKEIENNCPPLKFSEEHSNMINSSPSTINSFEDYRKSLNFFSLETASFNINEESNKNDENPQTNDFLCKKKKLHFDLAKDNSDNSTNISSLSIDNSLNKKIEKNEIFEVNDTENVKKLKNIKKKKSFYNEGRWSFEEHTKFIEALVEYRKNWKNMQIYIGTRSSSQVRSHAQKFLLKLKTIENPKFNFDFKNSKIKNLNDIIEEIIRKKENNNYEKKHIIDILIDLSLTISNENSRLSINKKKTKCSKEDSKINIENHLPNNISQDNKKDIINMNKIKFSSLNEGKLEELKNGEENKENKLVNNMKIKERKKNIINKDKTNTSKEEKDKSLGTETNINLVEEEPILFNDDFYCNSNKRLVIDDGVAFYVNDSEIFNYNNISQRIKDYYYHTNYESSYLFNKYFFS